MSPFSVRTRTSSLYGSLVSGKERMEAQKPNSYRIIRDVSFGRKLVSKNWDGGMEVERDMWEAGRPSLSGHCCNTCSPVWIKW